MITEDTNWCGINNRFGIWETIRKGNSVPTPLNACLPFTAIIPTFLFMPQLTI